VPARVVSARRSANAEPGEQGVAAVDRALPTQLARSRAAATAPVGRADRGQALGDEATRAVGHARSFSWH